MKNRIIGICLLLTGVSFVTFGQEDMAHKDKKYANGMAIYAEFGALPNNSFNAIRTKMKQQQITPFENTMASIVLAKRLETRKWFAENRLILMNSTNYTNGKDDPKGYFGGIGIGMVGGPKLVNAKHWNVSIPLGYDLMLYRTMVKHNGSTTFGQFVRQPSGYQSVKMYNANINLQAGLGIDYKINIKSGFNDKMYISSKVTYQYAVARNKKWKGDDVTIADLPAFRPDQLYVQLGLVMFPKKAVGKRGCSLCKE